MSRYLEIVPFTYGTHDVELKIRADGVQVNIRETGSDSNVPDVMNTFLDVEIPMDEIDFVEFGLNTTTNNNGWTDNLSFECDSNFIQTSMSFDRRDVDRDQPDGDNGKEFVADLEQANDDLIEITEVVGEKTAGGGRVQELTNLDIDGFVDVRGFKTFIGFDPAVGADIYVSDDLVEEGFRFNAGRFGIDKSGKRKNEGFPGDEGETSGAKLLNSHELLLFDFSDGDFRANEATFDVKLSNRDDDGIALDGMVLTLERNGSPDNFTVLSTQLFGPSEDGVNLIDLLDDSVVVGIILGEGEAGQIGVSFSGTTTTSISP